MFRCCFTGVSFVCACVCLTMHVCLGKEANRQRDGNFDGLERIASRIILGERVLHQNVRRLRIDG